MKAFKGDTSPIEDGEAMGFMQMEMRKMIGVGRSRISAWKAAGRAPIDEMRQLRRELDKVVQGLRPPPENTTAFETWRKTKMQDGNEIDKLLNDAAAVGLSLEQVAKAGSILPGTLKYWRKNSKRLSLTALQRMRSYVTEVEKGRNVPKHAAIAPPDETPKSNGTSATFKEGELKQNIDISNVKPKSKKNHSPAKAAELAPQPKPEPVPEPIPEPEPEPEIVQTQQVPAVEAQIPEIPQTPVNPDNIILWQVHLHGRPAITAATLVEAATSAMQIYTQGPVTEQIAQDLLGELRCAPLTCDVTIVTPEPLKNRLAVKTTWCLEEIPT